MIPNFYIGCGRWDRKSLKGFYPKEVTNELKYYSQRFNCTELSQTFKSIPTEFEIKRMRDNTSDDFRFFPIIPKSISYDKKLIDIDNLLEDFCLKIGLLVYKMRMVFLELPEDFSPKYFDNLKRFISIFPVDIPLAIELRDSSWFKDEKISNKLYTLLEENKVTNILIDTAGHRDLLHMRLTTPTAFIRFVGANHPVDYERLNDWAERINKWIENGLENLYFLVYQNEEQDSHLLANHFIESLIDECGIDFRDAGILN